MKIAVLLLFALAFISDTLAECPSGWVTNSGSCFKFFTAPSSWTKAESACLSLKSELAAIDSPQKSVFVKSYITEQGLSRHWWIGGRITDGGWFWSSELSQPAPMEYTDWGPGEPNNKGKAPCLHLFLDPGNGGWNDQFCHRTLSYICEKKDNSAPPVG